MLHPPLDVLCRQCKEDTNPEAYRRTLVLPEIEQRACALRCIQQMQFVRDQFSHIVEHLCDEAIAELAGKRCDAKRGNDFVRFYLAILKGVRRDATCVMAVTGMLMATTHGFMDDRVEQLEHPAVRSRPLPWRYLAEPQGTYISTREAFRRFHDIFEEVTGTEDIV